MDHVCIPLRIGGDDVIVLLKEIRPDDAFIADKTPNRVKCFAVYRLLVS